MATATETIVPRLRQRYDEEIRAALERAYASRKPAVVNVVTDYTARATTIRFSAYST